MIEIQKAHELDIVELTEDLPEFGLRRGERGTVVEVFDNPEEAYVLEFVDESDASSKLAYGIRPDQIINVAPYIDAEGLWHHIKLYKEGGYLREKKIYKPSEDNKDRVADESFFRAVAGNGERMPFGAYRVTKRDVDVLIREKILEPEQWQDISSPENAEQVCTKARRYKLTDEGQRLVSLNEEEVLAYFAAKGIHERMEHDEQWGY